MKRGATTHPKIVALGKSLAKTQKHVSGRVQAIGLLECLYHFAMTHALDGDITRFCPDQLACALEWDHEPALLVDLLVQNRLLDRTGTAKNPKIVIHDWSEHADRYVSWNLCRKGLLFADGKEPKGRGGKTRHIHPDDPNF